MGKYTKAIVAAVSAALVTVSTFVAPTSTAGHIVTVALAAAGAVGVYWFPNDAPKSAPPPAA